MKGQMYLWSLLSPVCRLTVHRLAARTLIRSLETENNEDRGEPDEGVKKKVVELSVQSGVSSAFTSFIAVNKDNSEAVQGPLVRRDVPTPSEYISESKLSVEFKVFASGLWLIPVSVLQK